MALNVEESQVNKEAEADIMSSTYSKLDKIQAEAINADLTKAFQKIQFIKEVRLLKETRKENKS